MHPYHELIIQEVFMTYPSPDTDITQNSIPPDMPRSTIYSRFVTGLATMAQHIITLLDINLLMHEGVLSHTGEQNSYTEGVAA